MVFLNQGINRIRDLHHDDLDTGISGTDGTAVATTQTGLQNGVPATELTLTKTKSDKSLQTSYRIPSTVGTGNTYREYCDRNSSDTDLTRVVFPGVAHTANDEIVIVKNYEYR